MRRYVLIVATKALRAVVNSHHDLGSSSKWLWKRPSNILRADLRGTYFSKRVSFIGMIRERERENAV